MFSKTNTYGFCPNVSIGISGGAQHHSILCGITAPNVTADKSIKPRLVFTTTWFKWLKEGSQRGSISFGCKRPQAKVHVVFLFTGLLATVLQSYLVMIFVVLQLCTNRKEKESRKAAHHKRFLFFIKVFLKSKVGTAMVQIYS